MTEALRDTVLAIGEEANASAIAVAAYDFSHHTTWSLNAHRWFHAASTIKVPVLLAVYEAIEHHRFEPHSRVHVRNRFLGIVDGKPFRVSQQSEANAEVHAAVGHMLTVHELAEHMIVTSSNLATNLLLDLLGVRETREALERLGLSGIDVVRGVEDLRAHEAGIDNRVTADGLLALLRLVHEGRGIGADGGKQMLDVLSRQELQSATRLGLPESVRAKARVANKTGEISNAAHDAGLVFLPDRKPFALVVLSEWPQGNGARQAALGQVVNAVYRHLVEPPA